MKNCLLCGDLIPNWIKIDGKRKNISSRKYCLKCSPYKKHNTKKLHLNSNSEKFKKCKSCGKKQSIDKFRKRTDRENLRVPYCKKCQNKEMLIRYKKRHYKLKLKAVKYLGGKCHVCGYSKNIHVLDFHHKNPKIKKGEFIKFKSEARIEKELDRCVLLCSNCHRELHYNVKSSKIIKKDTIRIKKLLLSLKQKAVTYLGGKCSACGYKKCIAALEFHHISKSKEFNISKPKSIVFEKIKTELDKCSLLCSNCHRETHHNSCKK